jgi:hypothetical protein
MPRRATQLCSPRWRQMSQSQFVQFRYRPKYAHAALCCWHPASASHLKSLFIIASFSTLMYTRRFLVLFEHLGILSRRNLISGPCARQIRTPATGGRAEARLNSTRTVGDLRRWVVANGMVGSGQDFILMGGDGAPHHTHVIQACRRRLIASLLGLGRG